MGILDFCFGIPTNLISMQEGFDMMTITFKKPNKIVVCYGTEEEISIIRETIQEFWKGLFTQIHNSYL